LATDVARAGTVGTDLPLPPSLREWLPEDHLAFFVSDLIDQLDLTAITHVYEDEERSYPPYHPGMLTKVRTPDLRGKLT
jgi:hypothetical protein